MTRFVSDTVKAQLVSAVLAAIAASDPLGKSDEFSVLNSLGSKDFDNAKRKGHTFSDTYTISINGDVITIIKSFDNFEDKFPSARASANASTGLLWGDASVRAEVGINSGYTNYTYTGEIGGVYIHDREAESIFNALNRKIEEAKKPHVQKAQVLLTELALNNTPRAKLLGLLGSDSGEVHFHRFDNRFIGNCVGYGITVSKEGNFPSIAGRSPVVMYSANIERKWSVASINEHMDGEVAQQIWDRLEREAQNPEAKREGMNSSEFIISLGAPDRGRLSDGDKGRKLGGTPFSQRLRRIAQAVLSHPDHRSG